MPEPACTFSVAVIGAGISGLAAAVKLLERFKGQTVITIFEKGSSVGGTWHFNHYPGAACDVPSHLYSYSFAPNADWSRKFAPQQEIQAYLKRVARDFLGLQWAGEHGSTPVSTLPNCSFRFKTKVESAEWNGKSNSWAVSSRQLDTGEEKKEPFHFIFLAPGALSTPNMPDGVPGIASFKGRSWHTAQWENAADLTGKVVAVVGTGASAAQVVPELVKTAKHVHVLQRTPSYLMPRGDYAYAGWLQTLFRLLPLCMLAYRLWLYLAHDVRFYAFVKPVSKAVRDFAQQLSLRHLRKQTEGRPELTQGLTPSYPLGCKRVLMSDDFFLALTRNNCSLHVGPLVEVQERAVVVRKRESSSASSVTTLPVDCIVYATGFDLVASIGSLRVKGEFGKDLSQQWAEAGGPEAYLGIVCPNMPNFFMAMGPNTGLGHSSMILMIEAQIGFAVQCVERCVQQGVSNARKAGQAAATPCSIAVRQGHHQAYNRQIQQELQSTVWTSCSSWYNLQGRKNIALWPRSVTAYIWATSKPQWDCFALRAPGAEPLSPGY